MATIAQDPQQTSVSPKQNWVVSPTVDMLFIVAAPLVAFLLFAPLFLMAPRFNMDGTALVFTVFVGFNFGHHVPMFIRIWGDRSLVERFRWNLFLAPIVPFVSAMIVASYIITQGYDLRTLMLVFIVLFIWDPWHFLMQNYGFVRIYDRHNEAPRKLASRMDLAFSWAWFITIMLGAVNWLPGIFYKLQLNCGISLLWLFGSGTYAALQIVSFVFSIGISIIYVGYLFWCHRKGYYISPAKIAFFLFMYGMMYLTYVPNPLAERLLPGWGFMAGFATLGMVHVSQNMAIVWKYSRTLAERGVNARPGLFTKLFSRGGGLVLVAYVALCLTYGFGGLEFTKLDAWFVVTTERWPELMSVTTQATVGRWVMWLTAIALAFCFTSTITHYYFEGFVWKMRHKENRKNLLLQDKQDDTQPETEESTSWWYHRSATPALKTLGKHCLYFGLPIGLLAGGAWAVHTDPVLSPGAVQRHAQKADQFYRQGLVKQSLDEFKLAIAAAEAKADLERQMIDIRPTPAHYVRLASSIYLKSRFENLYKAPLERGVREVGQLPVSDQIELKSGHCEDMREALAALEAAMRLPTQYGELAHASTKTMGQDDVNTSVSKMRKELDRLEGDVKQLQASSGT